MADREQKLAIIVTARDLASRTLKGINKELGGFGKGLRAAGRDLSKGVGNAVRNVERIGAAGIGLAVAGGAAAVKWASDFEDDLNTINTIARVTPDQLSEIGSGIRGLARDTGADLSDLTAGYYDLLSAGIKVGDAQTVLNQAYKLGRGALGSTAQGVDVLTTALNAYNLKGDQAGRISNELAKAVEDGKVTLDQIAGSYANVAPVAAQAGISTTEVAAAYGFLTAKGQTAAKVSTQMARAIIELQKPTGKLRDLQEKVGKNYAQIAKQKGLSVALQEAREDAKKAGIPFIELFGRIEAYKFALQTTGKNQRAFQEELDRTRQSAGTLDEQVGERNKGLAYSFRRLKANVHDAGITIGTALLPQIADLAEEATTFIQGHQGDIQRFAQDLAKGFKNAVSWARKLDWDAIANDVKAVAGAAKGIIEGFLSAPAWLQQAVLTGWGLNKLTGGAVVDIGVDLTKGAIGSAAGALAKGMFSRGSSPATPMYTKEVGLGGAAGGGLGGAAKGGLGTLGKVALVGEAIGLTAAVIDVQQSVSSGNSALAGEISNQTDKFLASQPSKDALESSLAAIDKGIDDIQSNPLNVLVQGDALDQLKAMREKVSAQLASMNQTQLLGEHAAETRAKTANDYYKSIDAGITAGLRDMDKAGEELHSLPGPIAIAMAQRNAPYVQRQLQKAQDILNSNRSTKDKIAELERVAERLDGHSRSGLAAVRSEIRTLRSAMRLNVTVHLASGKGFTTSQPIYDAGNHGRVAGRNATGGPVQVGRLYQVNEQGHTAELFAPLVPGSVFANTRRFGSSDLREQMRMQLELTVPVTVKLSTREQAAKESRYRQIVLGRA